MRVRENCRKNKMREQQIKRAMYLILNPEVKYQDKIIHKLSDKVLKRNKNRQGY